MNDMIAPEDVMVLTEEEAVELLALLASNASELLYEPADFGPMRLIEGVHKLVRMILPRATAETRPFLAWLDEGISSWVPGSRRRADPEGWQKFIDEANRWVARELMRRAGKDVQR